MKLFLPIKCTYEMHKFISIYHFCILKLIFEITRINYWNLLNFIIEYEDSLITGTVEGWTEPLERGLNLDGKLFKSKNLELQSTLMKPCSKKVCIKK